MSSLVPRVTACPSLDTADYDCLVLVSPDLGPVTNSAVKTALGAVAEVDAKALTSVTVVPVTLPCRRLVFSPTGPLDRYNIKQSSVP